MLMKNNRECVQLIQKDLRVYSFTSAWFDLEMCRVWAKWPVEMSSFHEAPRVQSVMPVESKTG